MTREGALKLVGGYATNTLTAEERAALFRAALEDQEVFDALANDETLRELLEDPDARAAILAAAEKPPERWLGAWYRSAWVWAGSGVLAISIALLFLWMPLSRWRTPSQPLTVDLNPLPAVPAPPASELKRVLPPPPAPHPLSKRKAPPAFVPPPPRQVETDAAARAVPQAVGLGGMPSASPARFSAITPQFRVLRENAVGAFEAVTLSVLMRGDHIRIRIHPAVSGNAVLYRRGESGFRTQIYPPAGPGVPVIGGQDAELPATGSITLDGDKDLEISITPETGTPETIPIALRPR